MILILLVTMSSCTMMIKSPTINNFPNSSIPYAYTNFGEVPYNKVQSFKIEVLSHTLCGNISTLKHLTEATYVVVSPTEDCSSTRRARNAQIIGAKGLLIASPKISSSSVFPDDDGNGQKVHITVLFITIDDYLKLAALKDVQITVSYDTFKAQIAQILFYMSASMRSSYVFLRKIHPFLSRIRAWMSFKPLYHTAPCLDCSKESCVSSKYCTVDFDNFVPNTGKAIIKQQLMQEDIFLRYGFETYMSYMNAFDERCYGNWFEADHCTRSILQDMGIVANISSNMENLLSEWQKEEAGLSISTLPSLVVNKVAYHGFLEENEVFEMVCGSLKVMPAGCLGVPEPQDHQNKLLLALSLTGAAAVVIVVAIYIYCRCIQRELPNDMNSKVNEIVAHYATKVSQQNRKKTQRLVQTMSEEL